MSTHNYLDKTGLGQVWGKIKDYADPFIVTITSTTSAGTTTYSADKTFAEITAAQNAGKICIAVRSAYQYLLMNITSSRCTFSHIAGTDSNIGCEIIQISSSDIVYFYHVNVYPASYIDMFKDGIAQTDNGKETLVNGVIAGYNRSKAGQYHGVGDLFWLYAVNSSPPRWILAEAITEINIGDTFVENTNYCVVSIEDKINEKITPLTGYFINNGDGTATLSGITPSEIVHASYNWIPVIYYNQNESSESYIFVNGYWSNNYELHFFGSNGDGNIMHICAEVPGRDQDEIEFTGTIDYIAKPLIGDISISGTTATFTGLTVFAIYQAWSNNIPVYFREITGEGYNEYRKHMLIRCECPRNYTMEFCSIGYDFIGNTSIMRINVSVPSNSAWTETFTGTVTYATIPNPEDDINIINLLAEYNFVAPIEDADGYVITDVDENLIVI